MVSRGLGLVGGRLGSVNSLAEPGSPSTEAEMAEGLFGLNQRRQVPVDTDGW